MDKTMKVDLIGKGLYENIPDQLTLKALPTVSELDYVNGEELDTVLLEKILPEAIEEKVKLDDLLYIDFEWVCRCLRFLNFGPYCTANSVFCDECGNTSYGEYVVRLDSVSSKQLPEKFANEITIKKESFLDFNGDAILKLPTIREMLNAYKDKAFQDTRNGRSNRELARICYMVKKLGNKASFTPVELSVYIKTSMSPADYLILKGEVNELSDYGLRAGGTATCPKCGNNDAAFLAMSDDKFMRPTLEDLRAWKADLAPKK